MREEQEQNIRPDNGSSGGCDAGSEPRGSDGPGADVAAGGGFGRPDGGFGPSDGEFGCPESGSGPSSGEFGGPEGGSGTSAGESGPCDGGISPSGGIMPTGHIAFGGGWPEVDDTVGADCSEGKGVIGLEDGRYLRDGERSGVWLTASKVISTVMSPLIMPLVAVMALLYGNTLLGYIPGRMKIYFTLVILLNTCVVPMLCIGLLHSMGIVKGIMLGDRRDRVLPLMITAMCYVLCGFMVRGMFGGYLLGKFLFAGAACITLAFIVTFYWKISIHMLASGGTLAMLLLIDVSGIAHFFPAVVAMIAGCGALASARMYLGAHTPAQVAAGFTGGFMVALAVILI
ncbi:MAG: hypothetical protein LIO85_02510 [Rikenellaceae bacterium]|nr:hypothetical protein [Rikenellaceae bacterium]